jgi:predicted O-linked N-acetylglucosamine transferase (SPINDLY family)
LQSNDALIAAERRLLERVALAPDAAGWLHLGATQHALGKLEAAIASFGRAIELDRAAPVAYCAQATVLAALGRTAEAEHILGKAPDDAQVHFNLAVLLDQRGQRPAARMRYERALARDPRHWGARLNLGAMKLDDGDAQGALSDFDTLIAQSPSADAHANRARALLHLLRDEEALQAAAQALSLDPHHPGARLDRMAALASLGRLEQAQAAMPPAQEVTSELKARGFEKPPTPLDLYLARAFERQSACDWRDRRQLVERLRAASALISDTAMPFKALALALSAQAQRELAQSVSAKLPADHAPYVSRISARARKRIGFLSANVSTHPEGFLLRRLLGDLDRRQFEVMLYGLNDPDHSDFAALLRRAPDAFIDVSSTPTRRIVERLRQDGLDLLVETSGYLEGARPEILKARVAPVQVSYLSIPATLGAGLVDYRISDAWATPAETQSDWPESLVLLPPSHFVYDNAIRPGPAGTRAAHGLPQSALILCGMHQSFKLEPDAFGVWMRVLVAVPGAVLWLLDEGPLFRANLCREARRRGVAPERLLFAPRVPLNEHLGRLGHADLFLDTFCCNAHTTALDALWTGLPVLTRRGNTMASRLASTFVRAAGLEQLVADTTEEYEQMAMKLADDPDALRGLKHRLAQVKADSPLFDTAARVRAFERALVAVIERQRAGLAPETLIID